MMNVPVDSLDKLLIAGLVGNVLITGTLFLQNLKVRHQVLQ